MGKNFYYRKEVNKCECCGRSELTEYHIGKSSMGWSFLFSDSKYKTARGWKKFLKANPNNIFDEYGDMVNLEDMLELMERKGGEPIEKGKVFDKGYFSDAQGYYFSTGDFW